MYTVKLFFICQLVVPSFCRQYGNAGGQQGSGVETPGFKFELDYLLTLIFSFLIVKKRMKVTLLKDLSIMMNDKCLAFPMLSHYYY